MTPPQGSGARVAPTLPSRMGRLGTPLLLGIVATVLLLANLGDQSLWQDEAQTALIAKTILAHGVPLGTDGKNYFSQELGAEYGPNYVWRWHTWLPFYLLAACFAILGTSTFAARLPFALFGAATVVATYALGRALWRSERAGLVAGLLAVTSVPLLLISRQCRYYSVAALFTVLALYAYLRVLERSRWGWFIFVLAAVLLFHTHYVYTIALFAAVLADTLIAHREAWKRVFLACAVGLGVNVPWILWLSGMRYGERYGSFLDLGVAARLAGSFLEQLGKFVFPPVLLVVPVGILLWDRLKRSPAGGKQRVQARSERASAWEHSLLPVLFLGANLVILSFTAPAPFFRYLGPLLPVCAVLMAGIVSAAMARQIWLGIVILVGLILGQPLRSYFYEITHHFRGPVDGIVAYLARNGKPADVVAITYEDLSLKFYTPMRVVGGLTGEDLSPAREARWVIIRKHVVSDKDALVRQYLIQNVPWAKYRPIQLDVPDTPFQNRESPYEHLYRTAEHEDRVVIFERVVP